MNALKSSEWRTPESFAFLASPLDQKALGAIKLHDIHPVFGMEGYFTLDLVRSKKEKTGGRDNSHITLLAKNQKGLQNLWAWASLANRSAFKRSVFARVARA